MEKTITDKIMERVLELTPAEQLEYLEMLEAEFPA